MGFREIAFNMASRGVAVVPTQPGLRYPNFPGWQNLATTNEAQIHAWGEENPSFNCVSVAKFGGVGMYDIDDLLTCVARGMPQLPETLEVTSPSGGKHGYFIHTPETEALGTSRNVFQGKTKIFEFKGHNAACCAPGCTRDDGGQYVLTKDVPLIVGLPADLIRWIEENSAAKITCGKLKRKFHPEFQEQDLFDHYGWTFAGDFWKDHAHYWIFDSCPIKGGPHDDQVRSKKTCLIFGNTIGFDCKVCGEEVTWADVVEHMEKEGTPAPPFYTFADEDDELLLQDGMLDDDEAAEENPDEQTEEVPEVDTAGYSYQSTDTGNAERLVRRFGHGIRFVRDQGVWRVWDGKRWKADRRNRVDRLAKHIVKELHDEAASADGDEQKRLYQWAFKSGGRDRRNAMVNLAAMEKDIVSVTTDYDRDPWLFNVQNGVLDLKTGKLLPHNRTRLYSKISPVTYEAEATCPLFEKFINEIMGGDQEMIDFLATAAGYSLTGDTEEQAVMVSHGNGQNGKSVFHLTLKYILGDYAEVASFDTFVKKKNDNGPKNELAKLVGARMVMASESQDGERPDEALVKNITGGEPITVRFLHKEFFTYEPEFKVWMSSNYKPNIKGQDWGIWRRLKLLPFEVTVPKEREDKELKAKLRKEASGILNWMLKGLARYREQRGLVYPEKVRAATAQYRDSQDVVGQFLRAKCIMAPHVEIKGAELYASYRFWCDANREWVMKERQFTEALLRVKGITTKRKEDGKWYVGVGQTVFSKACDQLSSGVEVI